MGTDLIRTRIKESDIDFLAVPPGFESFTALKPKNVENTDTVHSYMGFSSPEQPVHAKSEPSLDDSRKISKPVRCRPMVNYGESANHPDDDLKLEQHGQYIPTKAPLPKGVVRGCPECKNCQKVMARYKPEAACRPKLEEVPVFFPSEEEFEDTLKYIEKIRPKAELYGICRIVPPPSWKPPCPLKEKNIWQNSKFSTRVQRLDKLQNRDPVRKLSHDPNHARKKRRRMSKMGVDSVVGNENSQEPVLLEFGFEPGPDFTLDAFQKYADEFKAQYFGGLETEKGKGSASANVNMDPSLDIIEGEYWRVVEQPTEEIEVLYGADLETRVYGSGFPKDTEQLLSSDEKYVKSGWNLNRLPRVPGSVLSYENSDISGVQVPWLYVGMCFSSFCWHVEDHYLYSLNYLHFGAPKLWYGVPGKDATKLEDAMRKHLPDLFQEQPNLLHKLVTQLSPTILKLEGVPVYRCIQNPGEFVLTFPRAYHAGFNCGFNCAEAVNVAPLDWFPHGQNAVELYRQQGRKTTISHDKLLLGAATEAVKANWELNFLRKSSPDILRWKNVCGRDGVLAKSLKARVDMERVRRDFLCKPSTVSKMPSEFDATIERECIICSFDLHLSAIACHCSSDIYACLNHAKQLCPCDWSNKIFLFRYDISELDLLVEAVEGRLSSVYRWARSYLGLSLSSHISEDNPESSGLPHSSASAKVEEVPAKIEEILQPSKKVSTNAPRLTLLIKKKSLAPAENQSAPVITAKDTIVKPEEVSVTRNKIRIRKEQIPVKQEKTLLKQPSPEPDVICLSDDEEDHLDKDHTKADANLPKPGGAHQTESSKHKSIFREAVLALGVQKQVKKGKNEAPLQKVDARKSDDSNVASGSPSCSQSSPEKCYRQKGPRIAKVIRKMNCSVEPLEYGEVNSAEFWSDSRAIFPKGFKSRVRYINVLDPTNMCHYISEVLDCGAKGPLFMVYLEHSPSDVFINLTPTKCWEMVVERVNQEIAKQHRLGKQKLPPLQLPGSLNGFEMFGLTSPSIIQAIETLDENRVSREYAPQDSQKIESKGTNSGDGFLRGLFMKANKEELHSLLGMLGKNKAGSDCGFITGLLSDEIRKRFR